MIKGEAEKLKVAWTVEASRNKDGGSITVHLATGNYASSAWFYLTAEEALALAEGLTSEAEWLESQS